MSVKDFSDRTKPEGLFDYKLWPTTRKSRAKGFQRSFRPRAIRSSEFSEPAPALVSQLLLLLTGPAADEIERDRSSSLLIVAEESRENKRKKIRKNGEKNGNATHTRVPNDATRQPTVIYIYFVRGN